MCEKTFKIILSLASGLSEVSTWPPPAWMGAAHKLVLSSTLILWDTLLRLPPPHFSQWDGRAIYLDTFGAYLASAFRLNITQEIQTFIRWPSKVWNSNRSTFRWNRIKNVVTSGSVWCTQNIAEITKPPLKALYSIRSHQIQNQPWQKKSSNRNPLFLTSNSPFSRQKKYISILRNISNSVNFGGLALCSNFSNVAFSWWTSDICDILWKEFE